MAGKNKKNERKHDANYGLISMAIAFAACFFSIYNTTYKDGLNSGKTVEKVEAHIGDEKIHIREGFDLEKSLSKINGTINDLRKENDSLRKQVEKLSKKFEHETVAFYAVGTKHESSGRPVLLSYRNQKVNTRSCWNGTHFNAPKDGVYSFSVDFLSENVSQKNSKKGDDEIRIYLHRNSSHIGYAFISIGTLVTLAMPLLGALGKVLKLKSFLESLAQTALS